MKYSTCWNDAINTFIAIAIIHACAPLATGSNFEQLCLVATVMTVEKKLLLLHIHICRCECHWSCTPTTCNCVTGSDICSLQLILFSRPICAPLSDIRLPSCWKESDICRMTQQIATEIVCSMKLHSHAIHVAIYSTCVVLYAGLPWELCSVEPPLTYFN